MRLIWWLAIGGGVLLVLSIKVVALLRLSQLGEKIAKRARRRE